MSLEIVNSYYEAFNRKDIDAILSLCSEDVINDLNQGDSQIGKMDLKTFIETAFSHFDEKVSDIVLMSSFDHKKITSEYLVDGTYYNTKPGLFAATNQKYKIKCAAIFTIVDNKITRITRYYNTKKWLNMVNPAS